MKSLGTSLPLPLKDFLSKQAYKGRGVFNNTIVLFCFFNLVGFPALLRREFKGSVFVKGKNKEKKNIAKLLNLVVFKNEKAIEQ